MTVVVVRELSELLNYVPAWEELVDSAVEPNIFYEPWFLIPAVEAFGGDQHLEFVLIFTPDTGHLVGPQILCGFFPLERRDRFRGLPVSVVSLWKHIHCYLCTPLVKQGYGRECLETFFGWLAKGSRRCEVMEFRLIRGDGPFHQLLVDHLYERSKLSYVTDSHIRALFRPEADADQYLRKALSNKQRKGLKRREDHLATKGTLEYRALETDDDLQPWIAGFLQLEAGGWKGKEGSALACNEADRKFFTTVATAAFQRRRLLMLALHLNRKPIAYRCSMLAEPGAFSFKIAFAEDYARFSPGVLLHLENIRYLHANPAISWMDSCTSPANSMLNHLWLDRRAMLSLVVGTGRSSGDLIVALMPLLRWLKRKLSRRSAKA